MTALRNITFLLCVTLSPVVLADASQLLGRYWFPERDGQIEIYQQDNAFHGRVVAYDIADQRDENNPDPSLRNQLFVGINMFVGFEYDAKSNRWSGGTIYDAREGKTYKCRLWFDKNQPSTLMARGYIGLPMLGRTEQFERVSEDEATTFAPLKTSAAHQ